MDVSPPDSPSTTRGRPGPAAPPAAPRGGGEVDAERLGRLLGDPALSWLVERARQRMAQGWQLTGTVTLAHPDEAQRRCVENLLGRAPSAGRSLSVRLEAVAVHEWPLPSGVGRDGGCSAPDGLARRHTLGPASGCRSHRRRCAH